jgi:hypothetical protein
MVVYTAISAVGWKMKDRKFEPAWALIQTNKQTPTNQNPKHQSFQISIKLIYNDFERLLI